MKKKIILAFSFILFCVFFVSQAQAEEVPPPEPITIHLTIKTNTETFYDNNLSVSSCESDNPASGNMKTTAYCSILQSGVSSDWNFAWAPGIFLNSINNIAGFTSKDNDGNDVYHYWSWYLNGSEAQVGLNQYELQTSDSISLTFIDPIIPEPEPIIEEHHPSSGSIVKIPEKKTFDLKKAYEFLVSQQKENGSWGNDLYTDWTAIAFGTITDYQEQKNKLIKYLTEQKTTDYQITDYERHSMALMALGIDPQNINGENYIEKIIKEFDGTQFGDKEKVNDDIFAIIVLQNINSVKNENIIKSTIDFILSKQNENGSWDDNVDMTSAGINALAFKRNTEEIKNVIEKAKKFLKDKQRADGGFGNISSTAWTGVAINSIEEDIMDWKVFNNTIADYFGSSQEKDGGMKDDNLENRIWQTAYTLTSLSGQSWNEIMQKFNEKIVEKKEIKENIIESKSIIRKMAVKKSENIEQKNILASAVNAIEINKVEPNQKQNWFRKVINILFGF